MDIPFLLLLLLATVVAQECDDDTMRRCRTQGIEYLDSGRTSGDESCKNVRENFNCLLWQTSRCLDKAGQDDNRESILKMWRYLQSFCESQGSWYTKACYQREDVKRCEALMPTRGYSTDTTSCRAFSSFRDCVSAVVFVECSVSDRRLLGTYLMEKGQQRAWNCPRDPTVPTSAPLASYGSCLDDSRGYLKECRNKFNAEQKEANKRNDSDMKHHKICCALVQYEICVKDYCASGEARDLSTEMREKFPYYSCQDHSQAECSSGNHLILPTLLLLIAILILHNVSP